MENLKDDGGKERKYYGTGRAELDHYFANNIGAIRIDLQLPKVGVESRLTSQDIRDIFEKFVDGLRLTLERMKDGQVEPDHEVNEKILQEFIEFAESIDDPTDGKRIVEIMTPKYREIRKSKFPTEG